jgi:hypothetical protein
MKFFDRNTPNSNRSSGPSFRENRKRMPNKLIRIKQTMNKNLNGRRYLILLIEK